MRLLTCVLGSAATTVGVVAAASLYGASQVIRPRRCEHRDDPASWGLACEDLSLDTPDGVRLSAWLARATSSRAAIIIAHGHGGNRHTTLAYASFLYPDFTVLMPDLRAHGESEGRLTSVGYHERLDLVASARHLRELGYGPIGVLGISMGGATAIQAAAETDEIDAVVSDSSFAALRYAVREAARLRGYPPAVVSPLAYLSCLTAAWRLRHPMTAADPLGAVRAIAPRPLLLIHGQADDLIRVDNARALYEAAGEPKELWELPAVTHARAIEAHPLCYRDRVLGFFRQHLGGGRIGSGPRTLEARSLQIGQPTADAGAGEVDEVA